MPIGMSGYVQSVQVQGTLYVGGGGSDGYNEYLVMTYDISAGKWATLPPYNTNFFAMTAINNHLVLVGGERHNGVSSEALGVWSEDSKQWTHPYPDMTISRHSCSAVVYKHYLVVAGGLGAGSSSPTSVVVMNTDTKQWYSGPPTPIALSCMKTAVVDDMCYFMGGHVEGGRTNRAYSVSLPALVSQLNSDSSAKDTQIWKELPQLPVKAAAPVSMRGSLLAVGGYDKGRKAVTALHLYQPDAEQWVKVADLPSARRYCTCSMISDQELLSAGGEDDCNYVKSVDLAQIN